MTGRLIECIDVADGVGECVLWRAEDRTVWWTDIPGRRIHRLDWPSLKLRTFPAPARIASFAFVEGSDDILLVAFDIGFALFTPESGRVVWLARPAGLGDGVRLNDGRVDPGGRFWAGSMMEGVRAEEGSPLGALYRLDGYGRPEVVHRGIRLSNSLCWAPEGDRIYFSDMALGQLYSAPFDAASGAFARPGVLRQFTGEAPDGAVTDAQGNIWLALWGGGRIAQLSPDGREIASIAVDALQPTCPALGGPQDNLLFVTTAREGLDERELAARPRSGALFVYETQAHAAPGPRARLSAPLEGL
jgi:sugar lactone lactonase YvrE